MADLFNRTPEQLREAFVRARFAEQNIFGRPDIEEWLAQQHQAEMPEQADDDKSHWNAVLSPDHPTCKYLTETWKEDRWNVTDYCARALTRATPFAPGDQLPGMRNLRWTTSKPSHAFDSILAALSPKAEIYVGHRHGIVIRTTDGTTQRPRLYMAYTEADKGFVVRPLEEELSDSPSLTPGKSYAAYLIADVLFHEWAQDRPLARRARELLCDIVAPAIFRERTKAETDFVEAVAVSADGAKILKVDWVAVANTDTFPSSAIIFPGSAFRDRKILRDPSMRQLKGHDDAPRMTVGPYVNTAEDVGHDLHFARYTCPEQGKPWWAPQAWGHLYPYVVDGSRKTPSERRSVLITPPEFCPSPLPEGGVEVKV